MAPVRSKKKNRRSPPQRRSPHSSVVSSKKRPFAKRKQWTDSQMENAVKSVLESTAVPINAAARDHGVPVTTLKDRLSGRVLHGTKPGPVPYLSSSEEVQLVDYLSEANKVGYGKTRQQVKVIAEKVAIEKGVLRGSRISDGWWRRFLQRHPKLSLRSGDSTGYARMNAMNESNLKAYFGQQSTDFNSESLSSPIKRPPLASVSNFLSDNTPKSSARFKSPLSKLLDVIPAPAKEAKTGKARVLTSAECIQMFEDKQHKKEQAALEKEERKRERERKRLEREELAKKKKEIRLEVKKKKELATIKRKEAVIAKRAEATKKRNTRSSSTRSTTDSTVSAVTSNSVIQNSEPTSESNCISSVKPCSSASSLPSTSAAAEPDGQAPSSQVEPALEAEGWECTFCYEPYCEDGKEWLECACGQWVHEQCLEDIIIHSGQERFCPFCINSFSVP